MSLCHPVENYRYIIDPPSYDTRTPSILLAQYDGNQLWQFAAHCNARRVYGSRVYAFSYVRPKLVLLDHVKLIAASVLGAKANPITALTGISHEKLNVWHNWIAWAMFVLALVHTFPFIVYHIWKGDILEQWNDGGVWVTGVVAIIAQAWLTFMSVPWIR